MKTNKFVFSAMVAIAGTLLFSACSKTKDTKGQKVAPQEFFSSTQFTVTPGKATGTGTSTVFTPNGTAQTYYVDGGTGKYFTITDGDTVESATPTITMSAANQYRFQIFFRDEDGNISNEEYTPVDDPSAGAYIHQFFFVPVATGSATSAGQVNDDGHALVGYVNLSGLTDHGGLSYQYADSTTTGTGNLGIGLNGYFSVPTPGKTFDMVINLRHGIQNKFTGVYFESDLTNAWYSDAFSKATNDVNAPYGATDFAGLVHVKTTN